MLIAYIVLALLLLVIIGWVGFYMHTARDVPTMDRNYRTEPEN